MVTIKKFTEIIAWQKAHELALSVYSITSKFPRSEDFGLTSQMRRATVSVPSNIVEGFKRKSVKDGVNFYNIAEGSLEELKYQLLLSKDLKYISDDAYKKVDNLATEVGFLLFGWKKSQKI